MKQLLFIFLLGFYSIHLLAQENKNGCSKINSNISSSGINSEILKLEHPDDFEKDSIIFQFPDSLKEADNYVYILNKTREAIIFRLSPLYRIPNITQEALDENGNWVEIEYIPAPGNCQPFDTEVIYPDHYIAFTEPFYLKGDFATKIRFKLIGSLQNYYSQPYNGHINICLLKSYKPKVIYGLHAPQISPTSPKSLADKLFDIYRSTEFTNEEKLEWVKKNWNKDEEKKFTKVIIALYRKMKDFENAFLYAEQLVEIDSNSGKGYLNKGEFYIAGTRECYPENNTYQRMSIYLALEEWNKAKKFKDSKEDAEKRIKMYTPYLPELDTCISGIGTTRTLNKNKSFHIGCWINRTVKYK